MMWGIARKASWPIRILRRLICVFESPSYRGQGKAGQICPQLVHYPDCHNGKDWASRNQSQGLYRNFPQGKQTQATGPSSAAFPAAPAGSWCKWGIQDSNQCSHRGCWCHSANWRLNVQQEFRAALDTATALLTWHSGVTAGGLGKAHLRHHFAAVAGDHYEVGGQSVATKAERGRMETECNKWVIYIPVSDLTRKIPILRHS